MQLTVIIVTYNSAPYIRQNLEAIFKQAQDISLEVVVVDNASSDTTVEILKSFGPRLKLIKNTKNLGFAKANNQALALARGRYILLLNPDNCLDGGSLALMLDWMDKHPETGVLSCRLYDADKGLIRHCRRFPSICDQLAVVLKIPHFFPKILDRYLMADFDYSRSGEADSVRGSCFMVPGRLFKSLGGLDEQYFIWFEEVDFCRQVKAQGLKVQYFPQARCLDHVGRSFSLLDNISKQKMFRASQLKYFKKWHPYWQYFLLKTAWVFGLGISRAANILKIKARAKT